MPRPPMRSAAASTGNSPWPWSSLTRASTPPSCASSAPGLLGGSAKLLLFDTMLTLFREQGLVKAKGRQRTDSTHVLAAIQVLNRLECIGETLRHALNILATAAPDWLQSWVPLVWFDRYSRRFEEYRLPPAKPARYALAEQIGADGRQLLRAVD